MSASIVFGLMSVLPISYGVQFEEILLKLLKEGWSDSFNEIVNGSVYRFEGEVFNEAEGVELK